MGSKDLEMFHLTENYFNAVVTEFRETTYSLTIDCVSSTKQLTKEDTHTWAENLILP